jgi:hypothetical protein
VRVTTLVMFGAGYVLGTKAGRERYAQIVAMAERTSQRLEAFSTRHEPECDPAVVADRHAGWREAAR